MNIRPNNKCRRKYYHTVTRAFIISDGGEVAFSPATMVRQCTPKYPPAHFRCAKCGTRWTTSDKNRRIKIPKGYRVYDAMAVAKIVKHIDPVYLP